ncbi:MAG: Bacterial archaeo-eukaryotic release factor family 12 [Pseudomonadota bacterium]|jgi:protein required for attachment to host cells
MKSRRNMILVAAERDLRLLVADGDDDQVRELRHIRAADLDRAAPIDGGRRVRFSKLIAEFVESEWRKGGYDRLTLVAGTEMLRDMRQELPDRLRDRIASVLDREMIDRPLRDIAGQLRAVHAL